MRLCFVSHIRFYEAQGSYYYDPGFSKLLEVVSPLCSEVELCAPVYHSPAPKGSAKLCISNLKLIPLPPFWQNWHIAALKHPLNLMRRIWPHIKLADAVMVNLPDYLAIWAWLLCLLRRKAFIIRMEGNWPEMIRMAFQNHNMRICGDIVALLHRLLVEIMVRMSTLTLVVGHELARIYGRGNSHVVCVISSTYHHSDIAPTVANSGSAECRLLYVGRLQNNKGLSELFRAARELMTEGLNFRIWVAGDGYRRNEIRRLAQQLGIAERVDFLGWVPIDKLKSIYRACDIFVLPSYTEGVPRTVLEAMSNGLPVVATRVGGIPEVVEHNRTGILVERRNAGQLKNAMRNLILDKPLRERMAMRGLKKSRLFTVTAEREALKTAMLRFGCLR